MPSCHRCKQSTNSPQAFLLTCRGCNKTWHHRCHMPPIDDAELVQRVRATNIKDAANGINAWTCRRCKRGTSGTPGVASDMVEDRKSVTLADRDITSASTVSVTPPGDVRGRNIGTDTPDGREQSKTFDRQESVDEGPIKRAVIDKREKSAARKLPHVQTQPGPTQSRDTDVQMATEHTPRDEMGCPQSLSKLSSQHVPAARKTASTNTIHGSSKTASRRISGTRKAVSTDTVQDLSQMPRRISGARTAVHTDAIPPSPSGDDIEMADDAMIPTSSESTPGPTFRVPQTPSSDNQIIGLEFSAEVQPRATSLSDNPEQEVRPSDVANQPQGNQGIPADDDPEDLYGPPVERRIIRILPSLAEELREQQRRAAIEKEKQLQRAHSLAPDWIFAKYANDPSWKKVPIANERRRPRKALTRNLWENGLDLNELLGCFMVENWVGEHNCKTRV